MSKDKYLEAIRSQGVEPETKGSAIYIGSVKVATVNNDVVTPVATKELMGEPLVASIVCIANMRAK